MNRRPCGPHAHPRNVRVSACKADVLSVAILEHSDQYTARTGLGPETGLNYRPTTIPKPTSTPLFVACGYLPPRSVTIDNESQEPYLLYSETTIQSLGRLWRGRSRSSSSTVNTTPNPKRQSQYTITAFFTATEYSKESEPITAQYSA